LITGIVQAVGCTAATEAKGDGLRIAVDIGLRDVADAAIGRRSNLRAGKSSTTSATCSMAGHEPSG